MATKKTAKKTTTTAKKTATKKTAAKKTAAKKTATKKTAAKKTAAKKSATKKTASKKAVAKKTAAKKTAAKKTAAKKTTAKKAATKTVAGAKAAGQKSASSTRTAPPPATASVAPLAHRLGVLSGPFHIDNPPHGFELLVPPGVEIGIDLPEKLGASDAVLAFVQDRSQVEYLAQRLKKAMPKAGGDVALWVAYPTSRRADINANKGWETLTALKLTPALGVGVEAGWNAIRWQQTAKR